MREEEIEKENARNPVSVHMIDRGIAIIERTGITEIAIGLETVTVIVTGPVIVIVIVHEIETMDVIEIGLVTTSVIGRRIVIELERRTGIGTGITRWTILIVNMVGPVIETGDMIVIK